MSTIKHNWARRFGARINVAVMSLSISEKIIFYSFLAVFVITSVLTVWNFNNSFLVAIPESGGTLTEGVVGTPRFVNPVIATSDADRDITSLVYSGLISFSPSGEVVTDLAESYTISEDGRTYSFKIRDDAKFHDGKPVTSRDVEFTILKIQDPANKSPRRPAWDSISLEKNSDKEISFTLRQPYAQFIENLSVGILPEHLWKGVASEEFAFNALNITPTGSGPYKIKSVKRNSLGLPTTYDLVKFGSHTPDKPYINNVVVHFYQNERDLINAYKRGEIESLSGISPENALEIDTERSQIIKVPLGRVFGVFFNQNQATVFANKEVRLALDAAIDKEGVIKEVLLDFGRVANGPVPITIKSTDNEEKVEETKNHRDEALNILTKNGWTLNETTGIMEKKLKSETIKLTFSLSTGSAPELKRAAEIVRDNWKAIGADVNLEIFETNDLNQSVIRPRKYDALFFGEVVGRDYDLYPFWHSSQRNDPGLNIALYTNIKADAILEKIRVTNDREARIEEIEKLIPIINEDRPAVFVYSPDFIYVVPKKLHDVNPEKIVNSNDRFMNISKWYIDTNRIWKIFNK